MWPEMLLLRSWERGGALAYWMFGAQELERRGAGEPGSDRRSRVLRRGSTAKATWSTSYDLGRKGAGPSEVTGRRRPQLQALQSLGPAMFLAGDDPSKRCSRFQIIASDCFVGCNMIGSLRVTAGGHRLIFVRLSGGKHVNLAILHAVGNFLKRLVFGTEGV